MERTQELEKILSLLRATLDATTDGILVVDKTGHMVSFNRQFGQMWRIPEMVLETRDDNRALTYVLDQLLHPEAFLKKVRELYNQPDAESFDTLEFKDGRIFERYSKPQRLDGRSVGRVWSFRDVTERHRMEEALRKRTEELLRSNQELEQFAHIASHDLQEPLYTTNGFIERLQEICKEKMDPVAHDYLMRIQRSTQRMISLVSDLLTYSRVSIQQRSFEMIPLNETIRKILTDLEYQIQESGGIVDVGDLPEVYGDKVQVRQLFQNLISNGIKFCQKNKKPHVTVTGRRIDAGFVEIVMKDEGIGIDPQFLEQIFQPFHRLNPWADYPGSGIGLAICQKIVQRHGGEISASSELGKGTTVTVKIPSRGVS